MFNCSEGKILQVKSENENGEITLFVKDLIDEFDVKDSSTKDVAMFRLSRFEDFKQKADNVFEDIRKNIPKTVAVISPPLNKTLDDLRLRKCSIVIIVTDVSNSVSLLLIQLIYFSITMLHTKFLPKQLDLANEFLKMSASKYYKNTAKFILVAVNVKQDELPDILVFLFHYKISNCVIITQGPMMKLSYNPLTLNLYYIDPSFKTLNENFPDKLKDFHGYNYKVTLNDLGVSRLTVLNGKVNGPDVNFIETVARKQNGGAIFYSIKNDFLDSINAINEGSVDIYLNTDLFFNNAHDLNMIETFDTDGFCALVPLPGIKKYFDFIIKPFDLWTWIFIFLSMICCSITWRFLNASSSFKNTNSSMYYIYAFISSFLGQLVPFRDHRPMQKLILQLTIMLTFIFGTLHQSIMIASITGSHYRSTITTIDELIAGDYSFYVVKTFVLHLNGSEHYQRMSPKIDKHIETLNIDYKKLSSQNIVIVATCSNVDFILDESNHHFALKSGVSEFYYKLEERFNTYYLKFVVAPASLFYERLQEFSLKVFESGIRQRWEVENILRTFGSSSEHRQTTQESDYYLNLYDIAPAFYILASGLLLSYFVAVIEIVYVFVHRKFREIKNRPRVLKCGKRTSQVPHQIIQVQPINQLT